MTNLIPDEAVEAAARALIDSGWVYGDHPTGDACEMCIASARQFGYAILTAAASYIEAQATAQVERDYMTRSRTAGEYLQETNRLRAGIEALRDEWLAQSERMDGAPPAFGGPDEYARGSSAAYDRCAAALDALLREGE